MDSKRINIGTARIEGLINEPRCSKSYANHYYSWNIEFHESSTLLLQQTFYKFFMGETEDEAKKAYSQSCENFRKSEIYEGDQVAVLFEDGGEVIAIAKTGEETWIDVRDKFTPKTFEELGISATSLRVF